MILVRAIFVLILVNLVLSCQDQVVHEASSQRPIHTPSPQGCSNPLIKGSLDEVIKTYSRLETIQEINLVDSCLLLKINYSGCGQRSDDFHIYWSGQPDPIMVHPPQISLVVVDTLRGATCMMWLEDEVKIDLRSITQQISPPFTLNVNGKLLEVNP